MSESESESESSSVVSSVVEEEEIPKVPEVIYPLQTSWSIYDHEKSSHIDYEEGTRFVGSFKTVKGFWEYFNNLPRPSDIFYQKDIEKPYYEYEGRKREVASISMFRKGIQPKWEDPRNRIGGEVSLKKFYQKGIAPIEYLDQLWIKLAMGCVGEQFSNSKMVTGVRVVDSSIPDPKRSDFKKPLYRIELWFSDMDEVDIMEQDFKRILDLPNEDKIHRKSHAIT